MRELTSVEQIRSIVGEPNPLASKKIYTCLNEQMRAFIQSSPLVMLSTVDELGFPTISPKGDKAGFVRVQDQNTLLLPELRGNKLGRVDLSSLFLQQFVGNLYKAVLLMCGCST